MDEDDKGIPKMASGARAKPIVSPEPRRTPANAMRIEYIAADFDEANPQIERLFRGDMV